jgi:hypothetical protein
MARWQSANVLRVGRESKNLWQFSFRGDSASLSREEIKLPKEPLPAGLIAKDWQTIYQPRLNIAWLPAQKTFLRVIQLPPADTLAETVSMLELQLEKLSPLPTAQIVWTFDLLPKRAGEAQTAIVAIVARNTVEEFLGSLEGQSYLADRLEVPFIDQLLATKVDGDGIWIYPGASIDESTCLVAWWYGGILQYVSLLHLPAIEERPAFVRDQLAQMAWAGELEGWLTGPPRRVIVADDQTAAVWREWLETPEQPVEIVPPAPERQLAAMTAQRAARDGARASLIPPEFTARYRQQFVERMWMRVIAAAIVFYLLAVVAYIAYLQWTDYKVTKVEAQARALQGSYTNALRLKARVQVMEDQFNLQFAALRCYKAVAETLPSGLALDSMTFQRGRTFTIYGSGDKSTQQALNDFNDALRKYQVDGQNLFARINVPSVSMRGAETLIWNFQCELNRPESE